MSSPSLDRGAADATSRGLLALACGLAALFLLPGISLPLYGSEGRSLVIARGMLHSGDPFSMMLGDMPYADVPFGSYWLIALSAHLLGGLSEAAGRLPSLVSYLATLLLTYHIGRRTLGARAGAVAALLLSCSIQLLALGRSAGPDPLNMFGTTLAMALLLEASEGGRTRTYLMLGLVMGLTALFKGLVGIALPAFTAVVWTLFVRSVHRLSPRGVVLAVLACLLSAGTPFLIAHSIDGSWLPVQRFWRESVVRALDPFDHVEPPWFYLRSQFELLSIWSLLLPAALWFSCAKLVRSARSSGGCRAWLRRSEDARRAAFPLFGFVAVFLFFTLSRSRRSHYLMPIAPFAALIVAQTLLAVPDRATAVLRSVGLVGMGVLALLLGSAATVLGGWHMLQDTPPARLSASMADAAALWSRLPAWLAAVGLMLVPAVMLLRRATAPKSPLVSLVLVMVGTAILALNVREPIRAAADRTSAFATAVKEVVPPSAGISLFKDPGAKLLYYLDAVEPPAVAAPEYLIMPLSMSDDTGRWKGRWERVHDPRLAAAAWPDPGCDGFTLWKRAAPALPRPPR